MPLVVSGSIYDTDPLSVRAVGPVARTPSEYICDHYIRVCRLLVLLSGPARFHMASLRDDHVRGRIKKFECVYW